MYMRIRKQQSKVVFFKKKIDPRRTVDSACEGAFVVTVKFVIAVGMRLDRKTNRMGEKDDGWPQETALVCWAAAASWRRLWK